MAEQQIAVLSPSALRALLEAVGLSFQRTRSWKWSPDPDLKARAERVLSLYREQPVDGPVVCFDERGRSADPAAGHRLGAARPARTPPRDLHRKGGTRYLFGACDVHAAT
jgi:hypothetical protein